MSTADYSACANDLRIGRRLGIIAPCRVFPPLLAIRLKRLQLGGHKSLCFFVSLWFIFRVSSLIMISPPSLSFAKFRLAMNDNEFAHFLEAQQPVLDEVVQELTTGEKRSHWMWFIFPQLAGLGQSYMARRFALHSLDEARRYLAHPILGERLRRCTGLVCNAQNRGASDIFGYPDELKFHSSMTLFALAAPEEALFGSALEKYFAGRKDVKTLELLGLKE